MELYFHFCICLHGMSSVKFCLHLVQYKSWKTNKLKKCNMVEGKHTISKSEAGDSPRTATSCGPCACWDSFILNKTKLKTDSCLGLHLTLKPYSKTQACCPSLEVQFLTDALLVEYIKKKQDFFIVFNVSSFLAAEYPSLQLNSLPFPRTCNFAVF